MPVQVFDIDAALVNDPTTKDLKELYNEDAVNQAIDLWINTPYRIGVGYGNGILTSLFESMTSDMPNELQNLILKEFKNNFTMVTVKGVKADSFPNERMVKVQLSWQLTGYALSGVYTRYWNIS